MIILKIIGLCGGSGSGKGIVSALFSEYDFASIDTDAVYHSLTSSMTPCLSELVDFFGDSIAPEGYLDRKSLAKIVYSDNEKLATLNRIAHKHILIRTKELIEEYRTLGKPAVLIDAPLLFESDFNSICDIIICVVSDLNSRVERIVSRDGISEEDALLRISKQINDEWLIEHSDYVIVNNGTVEELHERVGEIAELILK